MEAYFWLHVNPRLKGTTCGWEDPTLAQQVDQVLYKIACVLCTHWSSTRHMMQCIEYILGHNCRFSNDPLKQGNSILGCIRENVKIFTGARRASYLCLQDLHGLVTRTNQLVVQQGWNEFYQLEDLEYLQEIIAHK